MIFKMFRKKTEMAIMAISVHFMYYLLINLENVDQKIIIKLFFFNISCKNLGNNVNIIIIFFFYLSKNV